MSTTVLISNPKKMQHNGRVIGLSDDLLSQVLIWSPVVDDTLHSL